MKTMKVNVTESKHLFKTHTIIIPDDMSDKKLDKVLKKIDKKESLVEITELFSKHGISLLSTIANNLPYADKISFELNDYEEVMLEGDYEEEDEVVNLGHAVINYSHNN